MMTSSMANLLGNRRTRSNESMDRIQIGTLCILLLNFIDPSSPLLRLQPIGSKSSACGGVQVFKLRGGGEYMKRVSLINTLMRMFKLTLMTLLISAAVAAVLLQLLSLQVL